MIKFTIWDLKGGDEYETIQPSLYTDKCLYLVVWDGSEGAKSVDKLKYYVADIQVQLIIIWPCTLGLHMNVRRVSCRPTWKVSKNYCLDPWWRQHTSRVEIFGQNWEIKDSNLVKRGWKEQKCFNTTKSGKASQMHHRISSQAYLLFVIIYSYTPRTLYSYAAVNLNRRDSKYAKVACVQWHSEHIKRTWA